MHTAAAGMLAQLLLHVPHKSGTSQAIQLFSCTEHVQKLSIGTRYVCCSLVVTSAGYR